MTRPRTNHSPQLNNSELANLEPRERLIICARDLFQQKSFEGVNIREIMGAADVTQPTIYYYFTNKDNLFFQALLDLLQELDQDFNLALREPDFPSKLRALAQIFATPPVPNLPLLFHDLNQRVQLNAHHPNLGISLAEARQAYVYVNQSWPRAFEHQLREARRAGQIHASNPAFLSHYLLTLLVSYPHSPFNGLTPTSPDQSLETLLEFLYTTLRLVSVNAQI
jgi:AcrR family transcriptional regulator